MCMHIGDMQKGRKEWCSKAVEAKREGKHSNFTPKQQPEIAQYGIEFDIQEAQQSFGGGGGVGVVWTASVPWNEYLENFFSKVQIHFSKNLHYWKSPAILGVYVHVVYTSACSGRAHIQTHTYTAQSATLIPTPPTSRLYNIFQATALTVQYMYMYMHSMSVIKNKWNMRLLYSRGLLYSTCTAPKILLTKSFLKWFRCTCKDENIKVSE